MGVSMAEELIQELVTSSNSLSMTIGLYTGKLVRKDTRVYFIAERFSGWEIFEECGQEDIVQVEKIENFIGIRFEIELHGNRWICKDVAEDADLAEFLGVDLRVSANSSLSVLSKSTSEEPRVTETPSENVVKDVFNSSPEVADVQSDRESDNLDSETKAFASQNPSSPLYFSKIEVVQIRKHIQSHPNTWDKICLLLGKDAPSNLIIEDDDELDTFIQENPSFFNDLSKRLATENGGSNVVNQDFLERILNFEGLSDREQITKVVVIVGILVFFLPSDILFSLLRLLISFVF